MTPSSVDNRRLLQLCSRTAVVDGLETHYFDVGSGRPLVLLHGGEFGASAELGWERNIAALSEHYRVVAPDWLGFGHSAKVHDFVDGKARRVQHMSRFCETVGIDSGLFVGNSMGGALLLADAASESPRLPADRIVSVCGGGALEKNDHVSALFDYDGTSEAMGLVLEALFAGEHWRTDPAYRARRHASSIAPGAWESVAAARFTRPNSGQSRSSAAVDYGSVNIPVLIIEGGRDKLKPPGWARDLAQQIPGSHHAVIDEAGHCPQIERPETFYDLLLTFDTSSDNQDTGTKVAERP